MPGQPNLPAYDPHAVCREQYDAHHWGTAPPPMSFDEVWAFLAPDEGLNAPTHVRVAAVPEATFRRFIRCTLRMLDARAAKRQAEAAVDKERAEKNAIFAELGSLLCTDVNGIDVHAGTVVRCDCPPGAAVRKDGVDITIVSDGLAALLKVVADAAGSRPPNAQ